MASINELKEMVLNVRDLYEQGRGQEGQIKLLALRDEVISLKEDSLTMREELFELKNQLHAFREEQTTKEKLVFREPFYFLIEGGAEDGPFCQRCYDANNSMMRLIHKLTYTGSHHCPECNTSYGERKQSSVAFSVPSHKYDDWI